MYDPVPNPSSWYAPEASVTVAMPSDAYTQIASSGSWLSSVTVPAIDPVPGTAEAVSADTPRPATSDIVTAIRSAARAKR